MAVNNERQQTRLQLFTQHTGIDFNPLRLAHYLHLGRIDNAGAGEYSFNSALQQIETSCSLHEHGEQLWRVTEYDVDNRAIRSCPQKLEQVSAWGKIALCSVVGSLRL